MQKRARSGRRYLLVAWLTLVAGLCAPPFAAADYQLCTPPPCPQGCGNATCVFMTGSPPSSGVKCFDHPPDKGGMTCFTQSATQGGTPKMEKKTNLAAPKKSTKPISSLNGEMTQPTTKTLNAKPPPGAVKPACPTPGRC